MKTGFTIAALAIAAVSAAGLDAADQGQKRFFREPAINRDGTLIAFCLDGDVWIAASDGSNPRRLTDNTAYECAPAFSPAADLVAFSSDREGGMDVWIMPASGGEPMRLTWHSAPDRVLGFTASGDSVIFSSRRDTLQARAYSVPVAGGEPAMVLDAAVYELAFSRDGSKTAFSAGANSWWRRKYRGSGAFDIWIKETGKPRAAKATSWAGNDSAPMWAPDGTLYYVSDKSGVSNIWKMNPAKPLDAVQITKHARLPVLWPSISANGGFIVYACMEGGIRMLDLKTGASGEIRLSIASDRKQSGVLRAKFGSEASETAVSPDGNEIAFAVRGDIFVVHRKGGKAVRVTDTPSREKQPAWSHDGKSIVFSSDRDGEFDLYRASSADEKEPRMSKTRFIRIDPLAATPARDEKPVPSPDGKRAVFLSGLGDLYSIPSGGGPPSLLAKGPMIADPCWSPDGRWVAFSRSLKNWDSEIFIVPAEGGEPVNVTRDPDEDVQPVFCPTGGYLYFSSNRGGEEVFNIYRIPLTLAVAQKYKEDVEDEEEKKKEKEKEEKKDGDGKKEEDKQPPDVRIDFKEIEDRAAAVTSTKGSDSLPALTRDGKTLFFKSDSLGWFEIWKAATDGSSLERLTKSRDNAEELVWSAKADLLFYRTGGSIWTLNADGSERKQVGYTAEMNIDLAEERMEAFDEAWGSLRDFFYDPSMHGVDWQAVRDEYRPLAAGCFCNEDFNDLIRMMLGELGASHLGISGPGPGSAPEKTGFTGLYLRPGPQGKRYAVAKVLKDAPADREESKILPGEFLISVDRKEVKAGENVSRILNGKAGGKLDLQVAADEDGNSARTVTLRPLDPDAAYQLLYDAWVDGKRQAVERLSGGKLGYIHIQAMGMGSFRKFRRDYLSKVRDREGLVLDVRNNPGGYIHNQLWEMLTKRKPVGYFRIRGSEDETQPDFTWQKPVVLLINERSGSDAEIFPWGFRKLGIGKVIGVPTWGGVIGTGGTTLINGAWLRLPFVGWYTDDGTNLENLGVEPDIRVENHPEDEGQGSDPQIERAVKELLDQKASGK